MNTPTRARWLTLFTARVTLSVLLLTVLKYVVAPNPQVSLVVSGVTLAVALTVSFWALSMLGFRPASLTEATIVTTNDLWHITRHNTWAQPPTTGQTFTLNPAKAECRWMLHRFWAWRRRMTYALTTHPDQAPMPFGIPISTTGRSVLRLRVTHPLKHRNVMVRSDGAVAFTTPVTVEVLEVQPR